MLNSSLRASFDAGATLDALVDIYRYRFIVLQFVNRGRADLNASAVAIAFVVVDHDRYSVVFPGFDVHVSTSIAHIIAVQPGWPVQHPPTRIIYSSPSY